jgi:site-specific DNA recombinase
MVKSPETDSGSFGRQPPNLPRLTHRDAVADYIGHGEELRQQWDGLNLSRQVAIVKAVLNHATILPATKVGRHGLDPDRVVPDWRQ